MGRKESDQTKIVDTINVFDCRLSDVRIHSLWFILFSKITLSAGDEKATFNKAIFKRIDTVLITCAQKMHLKAPMRTYSVKIEV